MAGGLADDGPVIGFAMVEDPVVSKEGPEEGDAEFGVAAVVYHIGLRLGGLDGVVEILSAAGIDDFDFAIVTQAVFGDNGFAVFLKRGFVAGNFVPAPEIALQVYRFGRLGNRRVSHRPLRTAGDEEKSDQQPEP